MHSQIPLRQSMFSFGRVQNGATVLCYFITISIIILKFTVSEHTHYHMATLLQGSTYYIVHCLLLCYTYQ